MESAKADETAGTSGSFKCNDFPFVQHLAEAIPALVAPESWQACGGEGAAKALPPRTGDGLAGTLLVRQTAAVHVEIERLLKDLQMR